jgi:hypothetical protein
MENSMTDQPKPLSENDIWQTLSIMAGQRLEKPAVVCKVCLEDKPDHAKDCSYAVLEVQLAEAHYEFGRMRSVVADRELQLSAMREALEQIVNTHPAAAWSIAANALGRKAAGEKP